MVTCRHLTYQEEGTCQGVSDAPPDLVSLDLYCQVVNWKITDLGSKALVIQ